MRARRKVQRERVGSDPGGVNEQAEAIAVQDPVDTAALQELTAGEE
jgi:hypothetical protein